MGMWLRQLNTTQEHSVLPSAFAIGVCEQGASQTKHLGRWPPTLSSSFFLKSKLKHLGPLRQKWKAADYNGSFGF